MTFRTTDNSLQLTMAVLKASQLGRARTLELILDEALIGLPDADMVTITVSKRTEEPPREVVEDAIVNLEGDRK